MPSLIRKAEVNGSTIYRVRVGPLSKDEASSLCSKLQGQGGQCFVAKN
jgi:cell division protein FtsN